MKTLNTTKTKALNIFKVISNQHDAIVENGSTNTAIYSRMDRLLPILRQACFDLAKVEPLTAQALYETAENMLSEAYSYILNNVKLEEERAESVAWLNSVDEEMFDCNDEFGDLEWHTFDTGYCKQPILWKHNGKILNNSDINDPPF